MGASLSTGWPVTDLGAADPNGHPPFGALVLSSDAVSNTVTPQPKHHLPRLSSLGNNTLDHLLPDDIGEPAAHPDNHFSFMMQCLD